MQAPQAGAFLLCFDPPAASAFQARWRPLQLMISVECEEFLQGLQKYSADDPGVLNAFDAES